MEASGLHFKIHSQGDPPPEIQDLLFEFEVDELKMERLRRIDAWHLIEKLIPSLDVVFIRSGRAGRLASRLSLTPRESRVLDLVDGENSVRSIIEKTNSSAFESCQILFRLAGAEIIHIKIRRGEQDRQRPKRVLIVDPDGEHICPAISDILTRIHEGLDVRCHDSAFNRVPYVIKMFQPETLLIDTDLEDFDVMKLVKLLRQSSELQGIRIIAMASDKDEEEILQLYRVGFNSFLPKPFLPEELEDLFSVENDHDDNNRPNPGASGAPFLKGEE